MCLDCRESPIGICKDCYDSIYPDDESLTLDIWVEICQGCGVGYSPKETDNRQLCRECNKK